MTINEIIENKNTHFICKTYKVPPEFYLNKKDMFKIKFKDLIIHYCHDILKNSKYPICTYYLCGNHELIKKYNLLYLNKELFPNVRVICNNNVKGNNLLLIPKYSNNEPHYLIINIKLIKRGEDNWN